MKEQIEKLTYILRTLKKTPGRKYTQKTIESKLELINNIRSDFELAEIVSLEQKDSTALKIEFTNLYKQILNHLTNSTKEDDIMANLDITELSIISKLVPKFSGKTNELPEFLVNLETISNTIPTEKHVSFFNFIFKSKLDLKVQNRLKQHHIPTNINELLTSLKSAYKPLKTPNTILNEITHIKQKDNNLIGFATKIENLITELNELQIGSNEENRNSIIKINDNIAFNAFMNGLTDPQITSTIYASQVTTFTEAVKIAERASSGTNQKQIFQFQQKQCNKCGRHHGNRCPANGMKCHNCGKFNHFTKMCLSKNQNNNNNRTYNNNNNSRNNYTRYNNNNIRNHTNNNNNRNHNYNNNNNNYSNIQRRQFNNNNRNYNIHQMEDQGNLQNPESIQIGTPQRDI